MLSNKVPKATLIVRRRLVSPKFNYIPRFYRHRSIDGYIAHMIALRVVVEHTWLDLGLKVRRGFFEAKESEVLQVCSRNEGPG
jgi:hypothetical protein